MVKLLQRFDQQEIHREPHRPAPVRVPAEETGGGLSRLVVHTIFVAIDMQHIGVFAVMLGKRSNAVRGEKLVLVQHVAEHAHELPAVYQREQAAHAARRPLGHFNVVGHVRMVVDEPLHAPLEPLQPIHDFRLEHLHRKQRHQAHHGAYLEEMVAAIGQMEHVVVKAVLLIPELNALTAAIVHGVGDVNKVLEEFAGHILIGHLFACQLEGDGQHIQAVHPHPTGSVGLLQVPASGQRRRTVKHTDVVQAEKPALENVHPVGVLAVHPPGEVQQQLVEDALEKSAVGFASDTLLDLVNTPGGPGVHRWVDVAEGPLVGRQLPVGVHVPLAQQQDELVLGIVRIDQGQWHAVEGQVPGRVPGILPLIRHRDHVLVVQVGPVAVAPALALLRRRRTCRIALQPGTQVVVIVLLGPEQPGKRLPLHVARIFGNALGRALGVELISFSEPHGKHLLKLVAKRMLRNLDGQRHNGGAPYRAVGDVPLAFGIHVGGLIGKA